MKKKLLLGLFLLPLLMGAGENSGAPVSSFPCENRVILVNRSAESDNFIDYWENDFRKNNPAVCEIPYSEYQKMYQRYIALNKEDRTIVNTTYDSREPEYTIGSIIRTLVNKYYPNSRSVTQEKQKLDQSTIIVIATVVALVGATAISILYILKNNKVIK